MNHFQVIKEPIITKSTSKATKTIAILRNETYQSYKEKKLQINQKYMNKLKTLTVLTLFYGNSSYSITKLSR